MRPSLFRTQSSPQSQSLSPKLIVGSGVFVWLCVSIFFLAPLLNTIEKKLEKEVSQKLLAAGYDSFSVTFKGQTVKLSLKSTDDTPADFDTLEDLDQAVLTAKNIVRSITGDLYSQGEHFGLVSGPITRISFDQASIGALRQKLAAPPLLVDVKKAETCTRDVAKTVGNRKLSYVTGSAELTPQSEAILDDIYAIVKDCANGLELYVEGHTDSEGSKAFNISLSTLRAKTAAEAIVKRGLDAKNVHHKGFGAEKPLNTNASPSDQAKNRRVDFIIKAR